MGQEYLHRQEEMKDDEKENIIEVQCHMSWHFFLRSPVKRCAAYGDISSLSLPSAVPLSTAFFRAA